MADQIERMRRRLVQAFASALDAASGDRLVVGALKERPPPAPVALVTVGKAAVIMAKGAERALGDRLVRGLVIGPGADPGPGRWHFPCRYVGGDHPRPGEGSLVAGRALLDFLGEGNREETLLFCLSGGASSLVEVLPSGISLEDLQRANDWLLRSGRDIVAMNAIRQRLSCIKGGRLSDWLDGRRALVLALSDVPDNDPAVIGSGWLAPPLPPPDRSALPDWLGRMLDKAPPAPRRDDDAWGRIETRIVGDNRTALDAAAAALRSHGLPVLVHGGRLRGDVEEAAATIAGRLRRKDSGFELWGGECTMQLPPEPGRGGRCQHLALSVARRLAEMQGWCLLAVGTDGRDGNSDAAGALVDGSTVARGEPEGLDAREALSRFDSNPFLELAGDLLDTGPTGTNVNDIVIAARW